MINVTKRGLNHLRTMHQAEYLSDEFPEHFCIHPIRPEPFPFSLKTTSSAGMKPTVLPWWQRGSQDASKLSKLPICFRRQQFLSRHISGDQRSVAMDQKYPLYAGITELQQFSSFKTVATQRLCISEMQVH